MSKNKKYIAAAIALVAAAAFYMSLLKTADRAFALESFDLSGDVSVYRMDFAHPDHNTETDNALRETFVLDGDEKAEFMEFISASKLRKRIPLNAFTFVPGIRVDSVSTSDPVQYNITFADSDGETALELYTLGCDYIRTGDESGRYMKIMDKNWGEKLDAIIAKGELAETNAKQ